LTKASQLLKVSVVMIDTSQTMLLEALRSCHRVEGLTHNFYRYPARFAPEFAREVIQSFTNEGDCVLDVFMGGGTTIVEAIANGRSALGIDINPLAHFVADVKTTPLSLRDQGKIRHWADGLDLENIPLDPPGVLDAQLRNMPEEVVFPLIQAVSTLNQLEFPRQRRFARCALLKLGQWALESRRDIPDASQMKRHLLRQIEEMLEGLDSLVQAARYRGIPKNKTTSRRTLYLGTITDAVHDKNFTKLSGKPKLVLTSPPYPGVHVLYHRWQVAGRRETRAPYWLADLRDGHGESYYTLGGRSVSGLKSYFTKLTDIFWALRQFIDPSAFVVQLVAFPAPDIQLPAFLNAMRVAGYDELTPFSGSGLERPQRQVPNRKWYTYGEKNQHASTEILLFHRPHS